MRNVRVKGQSRRHVMSIHHFNDFFQRLNNCASGTLAHVILEMRLCRVALLSSHRPPLLALIIFLTVGSGIFLPLIRLALLPLIFLGETGPLTVAMVLKASRSSLGALLCLLFLLPPTRILGIFRLEVGPAATPVVLKVRRRFRLFRRCCRAWGGASASASAFASSAMS